MQPAPVFGMGQESHYTSASLGGIKRGDSDETGDLEARPTETADRAGSGASGGNSGASGKVTGDASAGGGETRGETMLSGDSELDDLTVKDASNPSLGLTGIGDVEAEDWAADTDPERSTESEAPHHKR